ncbi:MAG: HD domain-containing protein [Clostridia bacterium]|nr:HD domain-containing protein [Clostridia bacterium]
MRKTEKFDFYDPTMLKSYNLDDKIRYQLKMLDGMDAFTRRHSENVANITLRLCDKLHLDRGFKIYCTTCAYIHDIGKLFIPPSILQKPTKLTDEEFEIMKTHTTIGAQMCIKDLKMRPFYAGPLYHHEALNGTGYPQGLVKDQIPYEGQILRVADEFEAITAKRQYKSHVGIIETLNILIENSNPPPTKTLGDVAKKTLNPEARLGKIDKTILKALFKVVIDDTEYEIASRADYIAFLKTEIKRVHDASKYFNRMIQCKPGSETYEYYKAGAQMYLHSYEDPEKIDKMLEEFKETKKMREAYIEKLYMEEKQIKKLLKAGI